MPLVAGVISPHPPVLIPDIGGPRLVEAQQTFHAMQRLSIDVSAFEPETLIFISPHSPALPDTFLIREDAELAGTFARFGHPAIALGAPNDLSLARAVHEACDLTGVPLMAVTRPSLLDWGVLVPAHFLGLDRRRLVSLSISGLDLQTHLALGRALGEAAAASDRNVVIVASGDLSHRLTPDAPNGYSPRGGEFDALVERIVGSGELTGLAAIDPQLCDEAGQCGLPSFVALAGALESRDFTADVLSYEGPFGVGYLVASMVVRT